MFIDREGYGFEIGEDYVIGRFWELVFFLARASRA